MKNKTQGGGVTMNATVAVETITPQEAQKLVQNLLDGQRRLREGHVIRLATEMEQGNFHLSPDSILLIKGKLANGQHRMHAVILCGKPQVFIVMRSNDEALYKVLDCGLARTAADALVHMANANTVAAVASLVLQYDVQALTVVSVNRERQNRITRSHVVDYIEEHSEKLTNQVAEVLSLYKNKSILTPTIAAAFLHIASRKDAGPALAFVRNVYLGEAADAAFDLRERLIKNKGGKAKLPRQYIFGLLIKAYKSYQNGTRPGVLRMVDGEPFPTV